METTKSDRCRVCLKAKVGIKKWGLCLKCYQKHRKENISKAKSISDPNVHAKFAKEVEFIKNYFKGKNEWVYEPAVFKINGNEMYTPDFYDSERNVFIEVAGSRQAYHYNKEKYEMFKKSYPKIEFEIYTSDGAMVDLNTDRLPPGTWYYNAK